MGTKARLFTPVSAVSLDELVPADHFYRHVDRALDLTFVRDFVQACYAGDRGRPSVDPIVFFKLQLLMFFEGIRSERQLLQLAADRLSVRWYLGYNLDEALLDHSSLTRIRARYGLEVFRRFFEAVVEQCQQVGLVGGRELYVDATQVQADASLDSLAPRFAVEAHAALQEHLATLFSDEASQDVPRPEDESVGAAEPSASAPTGQDAHGMSSPPSCVPSPLPVNAPELVREPLAEVNAARHDWFAECGRQQRDVHGLYRRTADFRISTTDPDATPLRLKGGGTHLGYQT